MSFLHHFTVIVLYGLIEQLLGIELRLVVLILIVLGLGLFIAGSGFVSGSHEELVEDLEQLLDLVHALKQIALRSRMTPLLIRAFPFPNPFLLRIRILLHCTAQQSYCLIIVISIHS